MWLSWVGDSACNQAPACNHLPFLFICKFTEGQSCCLSCKLQCCGRGGRVWRIRKREKDRKGSCATSIPWGFPLQCQEWYISGRCLRAKLSTSTNCGSLWPTKAHPSTPSRRMQCLQTRRAKPRHKCVCVCVCVFFFCLFVFVCVPFYASLAYGLDFHMRELNRPRSSASQDVLHISKLLNWTENTFFLSCCWISEGHLSSSGAHMLAK